MIEPDFGQPRFLTEHPLKLLLKGDFVKVPILAGVTKDEFGALAYGLYNLYIPIDHICFSYSWLLYFSF